jgi:apolipoprotein N-acyltransferase
LPRTDEIAPKMGAWIDLVVVSCVVAGFMVWGAISIRNVAWQTRPENEDHYMTQTPAIPIAVIQGNVSIEEEKIKTIDASEIAKRYANLATGTGALMLFMPEGIADSRQFAPGMLLSKLKGIALSERKEGVIGTVERVHDGVVSAARLIANPLPKENIYLKQRLVPFGEAAQLGALGAISSKFTTDVAGNSSERVVNASYGDLLASMFGKVGISISNEIIFPNLIAAEVRRGAQLLVNITNLNRFHQSELNEQVLAAATLRAVENGRFMVLATNTGISAVIDPAGVVTSKSFPNKRGVIVDTVQFLYNKTTFNKMSRMWWL